MVVRHGRPLPVFQGFLLTFFMKNDSPNRYFGILRGAIKVLFSPKMPSLMFDFDADNDNGVDHGRSENLY